MRKLASFCLCSLVALSLLTGCAGSAGDGTAENLGTVTLAQYKGVEVYVPVAEVTDDEVENKVENALASNPNVVEVDREAAEGDIVNIDFKGTQDGVEFAGGSAEDQDLKLGSNSMIDGFEDGLIGAKKGETRELNLTFPEDYRETALAGQSVVFEVTINAVKEEQDAVLDDAFVQSISEYSTVEEYRESIRAELLAQREKNVNLQIQQAVLQTVVDGSQFKLSKNALSKRYNESLKQYKEQAKMYGMSLSQMAQANGMDEPGMKEYIYSTVEENAKSQLVINTIAAQEGLTLTDEDKEAFADWNGMTLEDVVNLYGQETVDEMSLNFKVMGFLSENAVNLLAEEEGADEAAEAEETAAQESESAAQ